MILNRLQFRKHDEVFETRQDAIDYIYKQIRFADDGLAKDNKAFGFSLLAEPTVLLYKNVTEEDTTGELNPHLIFAIGSVTNPGAEGGDGQYDDNRFCIIDIDKTEQEIADLAEELEKAIKSLTVVALSSDTINLYTDKTDEGTFISGDVKVAEAHLFDDNVNRKNNLMVTPEGIFIYVNLTWDEENDKFTFSFSNADGTLTETTVKMPNNYLVEGYYSKEDESIHLIMKEGEEVIVECEDLIAEWGVEGEGSNTPIVLTREEVYYNDVDEHHHVEPWQDVLRADVRIANDRVNNILRKTADGRYLYVNGTAQLEDNIIKFDETTGFFASVKLDYNTSENTLILTTTSVNGDNIVKEIELNTVDIIESITYDPENEALVIKYKNDKGETKTLVVPISGMIDEWTVLNDGHNVKLDKHRNVSGKDVLTADARISSLDNNILEEKPEQGYNALYVKGTADNIKYGDGTVKDSLDGLVAKDETLNQKIDDEVERATSSEETLDNKINQEITDRTVDVERINATIGDGFGTRFTVKDAVDAISANTIASLKHVVNEDSSIGVVERGGADGKETAIKVNLSTVETKNTIRLEGDGLYNFIDLNYNPDTNKLILTRSDNASTENVSKELQLNSVSFIDNITYDPATETLIITYHSGTEEKKVEINLGQIFQEWEVYNSPESAVRLNRERVIDGKDKLSGEVVITSTHSDNILINDNGALYVPANTDVTAALSSSITAERERALSAETVLQNSINYEKTLREAKDEIFEADIERLSDEDERLSNEIEAEKERAAGREEQLAQDIADATLTFEDSNSIDFITNGTNVTASVKLATSTDNIILTGDTTSGRYGVYASVDFDYIAATNKIKFKVNGNEKEFTIAAGSILDDAWYDPVTKDLVFRTKTADGEFVEVRVPAYDLFDEWDAVNLPSDSAIELTKVTGRTDPTTHEPLPDELYAKVLISPLEDNQLKFDTNGLYVPGSGATIAQCVSGKTEKLYELLYGEGETMGGCGESTSYKSYAGDCIISAATSFNEADHLLNDAVCDLMDKWIIYGFDTPSTHTSWKEIGQNRHMFVDARLSHGFNAYAESGMTDDELLIKSFTDEYLEPGLSAFSDTNVIRIVDISEGKSGEPLEPENKYNGIYLSNIWDCGLYYGPSDTEAKAKAQAAGYNTNYSTDETQGASGYDYNNNVR